MDDEYSPKIHRLTADEVRERLDPEHYEQVNTWLARGDGVAIYENEDLGHPQLGHVKAVSYGSIAAWLGIVAPPRILPDTPTELNWRYCLIGTYKGEAL